MAAYLLGIHLAVVLNYSRQRNSHLSTEIEAGAGILRAVKQRIKAVWKKW